MDIKNDTISTVDVCDQALTGADVLDNSVSGADVQNETIQGQDLGPLVAVAPVWAAIDASDAGAESRPDRLARPVRPWPVRRQRNI